MSKEEPVIQIWDLDRLQNFYATLLIIPHLFTIIVNAESNKGAPSFHLPCRMGQSGSEHILLTISGITIIGKILRCHLGKTKAIESEPIEDLLLQEKVQAICLYFNHLTYQPAHWP